MAKDITVSKNVSDYWKKAKDFVYACGKLASAHKLYNNMCDPDTKHVVEGVVAEHYKTVKGLQDTISTRRKACLAKIDKLNLACKSNGIKGIKSPDKLINLLYEEDRRVYYRRHIDSHMKRNEIVPLQDIEQGYQGLLEKRKQSKK